MSNVLTNKHVIIALIVAPILAVIAYFAVDASVSEKPHQAVKGESYPLIAKANCRYESGKCTFENGDISIDLETEVIGATAININLQSSIALQGAKMALVHSEDQSSPSNMKAINNSQTEWQLSLNTAELDNAKLQLALSINDTFYYGQTETTFMVYQTGFPRSNIK